MAEIHCPYCNAVVPPVPAAQPGQPITCPRCEETFRPLAAAGLQPADSDRQVANLPNQPPPVRQPVLSNRQIALGVVCLMGVMAAAGLGLALWTQAERRGNDAGLKRSRLSHKRRQQLEVDVAPPARVAPLELKGLNYLPADSDVIAGIHVAEALREAGGREGLEKGFPLPGIGGYLKRLETLTGLRLEDIDHIVAGARVNSSQGLPRLIVVVRTKSAFDPQAVRAVLKAREHPAARGRAVYLFQRELLPLYAQGLATFPNEQTLVLGWGINKLSEMPTRRRHDTDTLPAEITTLLRGRGRPQGPAWIAGHSDDWPRALALPLLLARADQQQRGVLARLRTFSAWLETEADRPSLRAVIRCADAAGAEVVEKYLRDRLADLKGARITRTDDWLDLRYRPER